MCGIAGIASLGERRFPHDRIQRMCNAIAHRGPDDAGYAFFQPGSLRSLDHGGSIRRGGHWFSFADEEFRHVNEHLPIFGGRYCEEQLGPSGSALALGHRRLSILDLSHHGHQPMASADQRFWIVYNGEAYNFRELRADLESRGYTFRTRSDTEVILYLWEEYREKALPLINGMFALAIYDRIENRLTLARDRFGVKPLYYGASRDQIVFGSEIKAILASGLVRAEIDAEAMQAYFTFQNLFGDRTLWQGIRLLEPGKYLSIRPGEPLQGGPKSFFVHDVAFDPGMADRPGLVDDIAEAFEVAVQRQLVSDVAVGSYLSGGMDSGSIVSVAGQRIPRIHTFTGGFDLTNVNGIEQGFDERKQAEQLSYLLQTEHYAVVLHAGDMPAAMDKISWHMDDPRVGMCHQVWYVAKLASRFVKVCLAGTGGDELFAGYPWRYRLATRESELADFPSNYFDAWHRLLPRDELALLFSAEIPNHSESVRASFDAVLARGPEWQPDANVVENLVQRQLFFEFHTFLNGLLITEDRISMAHGMESRVPFLDNDLARLAWKIPPSLKLHVPSLVGSGQGAFIDSADGKLCLRRAMRKRLPQEFLYQKKRGFSPPDENWYRGPSMDYIKEILLDSSTQDRPWFDQGFVEAKLQEHFEGRRNHRLLVWSLLSFEWIQRHFAESSAATRSDPASTWVVRSLEEKAS
jgi:asparagine synthase (glutamine-hydrolysing)